MKIHVSTSALYYAFIFAVIGLILSLTNIFSILHIGTDKDSDGGFGIATQQESKNDNFLVGHSKLQELWLFTNKTFYSKKPTTGEFELKKVYEILDELLSENRN